MPTLALTGDVMLGRHAGRILAKRPPAWPWGSALPVLLDADLRFVNLECVVSDRGEAAAKVFAFRAPPDAIEALRAARIDAVQLANNHVLDYGPDALLDMLDRLDTAGIARVGAGRSLADAWEPAFVERDGFRVGLLALTDNEPAWAAATDAPGVAHFAIRPEGPAFRALLRTIGDAAGRCDALVVAAHWGPNMVRTPPARHQRFARAVLDAGATVFWGTSAHLFQGIERRGDGVILYDAGDFVDDYLVDLRERNDVSFVYRLDLAPREVRALELVPTRIDPRTAHVDRAPEEDAAWAARRLRALSIPFGTTVRTESDGTVRVA